MTKMCGVFNTLLSTQESDSLTCSMAKDEIFNDCCFAGSDMLLLLLMQPYLKPIFPAMTVTQGRLELMQSAFNDNHDEYADIYKFLVDAFKKGSDTCV